MIAKLEIMDSKIELLETQHEEDLAKIKELTKNAERYKSELAAAKD